MCFTVSRCRAVLVRLCVHVCFPQTDIMNCFSVSSLCSAGFFMFSSSLNQCTVLIVHMYIFLLPQRTCSFTASMIESVLLPATTVVITVSGLSTRTLLLERRATVKLFRRIFHAVSTTNEIELISLQKRTKSWKPSEWFAKAMRKYVFFFVGIMWVCSFKF